MSTPDKYTTETITDVRPWTDSLFSFRTTRDRGYRFVPGQFARIGVQDANTGGTIWRAYSIASASYDEHLEFFSVVVPGGAFTSRLSRLKEGDPIYVERKSYGFLTTDRFEAGTRSLDARDGHGARPFLSILHEFETWERYDNLVLVQSVRTPARARLRGPHPRLRQERVLRAVRAQAALRAHRHARARARGASRDRVTKLLASGVLEENVGLKLDHDRSRIMLCGNPEMVEDSRKVLTARGYRISRRGDPGHLAVENYW
jgi:ferredoxin--NADP+ reductase